MDTKILSGWKSIAKHLQKGVRTVQRYERELQLPIRRYNGKTSVMATTVDLDAWVSGAPTKIPSIRNVTPVFQRTNMLGAEFLQIDSKIALTFSGLALCTKDATRKEQRTGIARNAYETIMRLRRNITLDDSEKNNLDVNIARLKSELKSLGQTF